MTTMCTATGESDVDDVARAAGLSQNQTAQLKNIAASWAMEGMTPTVEDLRLDAELLAGRIDVAEARRQLGV